MHTIFKESGTDYLNERFTNFKRAYNDHCNISIDKCISNCISHYRKSREKFRGLSLGK